MSYLFIDSTYDLYLGVLDDGFNWLTFEKHTEKKASAIIQAKAYAELKKFNIDPTSLKGVITLNGPGFYTGLRLAEGFSDVFSFFGVPQYSFYSYEVPLWCGHQNGVWFTKAYRGEYFSYQWLGESSSISLYPTAELSEKITNLPYFIHSPSALDTQSSELIKDPIETTKLIMERPQEIFPQVLKTDKRDPFYFRAPEDEFKANP